MGNLIIFFKIPPILQLEVGFFSDTKNVSQIFQNLAHLFNLSFIFVNLKKNQRNFFDQGLAHYQPLRGFVCIGFVCIGFVGGCQGRGVVGRCTRLRHRTCKTSRSSRKAQVHTASAQNVQDQSFKQKGFGTHRFGTERARLVVQVKELRYTASRLIGALRFARGFKKAPITHKEFEPKSNFF